MSWKTEWKKLALIAVGFVACFYMPAGSERFRNALVESLLLVRWYAREHVLLCLVPAFFIAGAIAVFISQASVIKYLGARANKLLAYAVASVSGAILSVCSCTVLPLFAGIYRMGAGLGPATAFLYSGPAVNVLAIILTTRVLGLRLGIARAVGAVVFSVVIGLAMQLIFRNRGEAPQELDVQPGAVEAVWPLWKNGAFFAAMVGILVFANWSSPAGEGGFWNAVASAKWAITALLSAGLAGILVAWFKLRWWKVAFAAAPAVALAVALPGTPVVAFAAGVLAMAALTGGDKRQAGRWFWSSWSFALQILPLLLAGVLVAGMLLGRPGHQGLIPAGWIEGAVGGNSVRANFFASIAGALMYFATLTEVPIVQGLVGAGMGKGPALALLLAGPALSLPNMLVIRSVLGTKKALVYVALVILMAMTSGMIFGAIIG